MKITPRQAHPRAILADDVIALPMQEAPKALGANICQLLKDRGFDLESSLRFQSVAFRFRNARASVQVSLKGASLALKVLQYRLKDIEERCVSGVVPEILFRCLDFLKLRIWYRKWEKEKEIKDFLFQNIVGEWYVNDGWKINRYIFEKETDAIFFKMRFG